MIFIFLSNMVVQEWFRFLMEYGVTGFLQAWL